MADDCFNKIMDEETKKKLFGDAVISRDVLRRFVDDVESIRKSAEESPQLGTFGKRLNEYIKKQREFNEVTKQVRKQDLVIAKELMAYARQEGFKDNAIEALKSKLTFSTTLAEGARDGAESRGFAIAGKIRNHFLSSIEKNPEDLKAFNSGQLDKEIWIEARALSENRGIGASGSEQAKRIAQTVNSTNQLLFREMRNSGIPVRELSDRVAPLTHDIAGIRNVGEDVWVDAVKKLPLDRKRMFGEFAGDATKEDAALRQIYKGVILGKQGVKTAATVDSFDEVIYGSNLSKKLSESRQLKFTSAEGEFSYNEQFGKANLSELLMGDIDKKARMLGLVQIFGSNPERMIRSTLSRLEASFRREGKFDAAKRIQDQTQNVMFQLHEVSGRSAIPGDNTLANIGQNLRAANVLSKLWNSGPRSLSNFATTAMALKTYTGKNFFQSLGETVMEFSKALPPSESTRMQKEIGHFVLDLTAEINGDLGGAAGGSGLAGKTTRLFFKANFMDALNARFKTSFARVIMSDIADNTGKHFDSLDPRLKATMMSIGVDKGDWDLMKYAIEEMPDGRKMVTRDGISAMLNNNRAAIDSRVGELKKEGTRISPERYVNELSNKYFGFIIQGSNVSSTSAGARERAVFTRGTYKGETWGEALRFLGQFKTFWAQSYNIGLMAMNANPDEAKLARGILTTGKKDWITPAQWMVTSAAFAYVAQGMIDLSNGKNIEDPTHLDTWQKAFMRGGAGGMYTDLLLGDLKNFGAAETILGPTLGQLAGPGAKLFGQVRDDYVDGNAAGQHKISNQAKNMATRLVRNNMPFQQALGMKQALDYVQYDIIQESLTPGYKTKRSIKNMLEERKNRLNIGFGGSN